MAPSKTVDPELAVIMADLASDRKSGNVYYLKDGETTGRLVLPQGATDKRGFYAKFNATFKGGLFVYYLVAMVITECDEEGVADESKVRYVKVPATIMDGIVGILSKSWGKNLFNLETGNVVTITRGKKGTKATYAIQMHPITHDASKATYPEQTIVEAALDQERSSAELDATKSEGGEALK